MFAIIKKNEGLAKVIDAPSLKAACQSPHE